LQDAYVRVLRLQDVYGRLREKVLASPAVLLLPEPEAVEAQLQARSASAGHD
jgi:hypothetical protein